ncbi:uncharacterized protein LOC113464312 isoform X2 [Ceratina calcarata]|uniref:Uncharacterized protein LOC113464312 isoform X1 n=1 Tax=Ceratina calcarata TaxID=156304 RepID=A0AAJ7S0I5_9HYME|nr:uncharacterized protein LOC113464312 isoform X1 [Ceratina calcarata]XP_026669195.1 uncharacterized protein LOC113464312 isoform X2 [Ceratina calcarata]
MPLPLIVILNLIVCTCQVLSQSNTYDYSDQRPWSLVYALYPFYNTETLLQVWRGDNAVDISANVITVTPQEQEQRDLYSEDVQRNNTGLKSQNNFSYFSNDSRNINKEQLSTNRQRLSNYRSKRKDISSQNE